MSAKLYAIGAEFGSASDLYHAAEKIRDRGFRKWDVFSPFPIHGMDDAMGLGKSHLSAFVFVGGVTGALTGFLLQTIPSLVIYPLVVQGKPTNLFTIPAFFPVIFELTVLFSAFAAVFGMFALNRMPRWHHPLFDWERFERVTDDGFFAAIEASDPKFSIEETRAFLESIGGKNITLVEEKD